MSGGGCAQGVKASGIRGYTTRAHADGSTTTEAVVVVEYLLHTAMHGSGWTAQRLLDALREMSA